MAGGGGGQDGGPEWPGLGYDDEGEDEDDEDGDGEEEGAEEEENIFERMANTLMPDGMGFGSRKGKEKAKEEVPADTEGGGSGVGRLLAPRPLWSGLLELPRITGLEGATIDTRRGRICTVTSAYLADGRHCGGDISLWSLRSGELLTSNKLPMAADKTVRKPRGVIYAPKLRCFVGLSGMATLWAADLVTLLPAGDFQVHDRRVLSFAFNHALSAMVAFCADGIFKVVTISCKVVRDNVRVRNVSRAEFVVARTWHESAWIDVLEINDELNVVFGAAETSVYMWSLANGQKLSQWDNCHRVKVTSLCSYKVRGEYRLISGDLAGELKLWVIRPDGIRLQGDYTAHRQVQVTSIVYEPSENALLTFAASVPSVKSWDEDRGACTGEFSCYPPDLKSDASMVGGKGQALAQSSDNGPGFATPPCFLKVQVPEHGKPILLMLQGTLVRCFRISSDCHFLAMASGPSVALHTLHPEVLQMRTQALRRKSLNMAALTPPKKSKTELMLGGESGTALDRKATSVISLSAEGVLEFFSGVDGVLMNVIEPAVSRDVAAGGGANAAKNGGRGKGKRKKGRGRGKNGGNAEDNEQKRRKWANMSLAERRAILSKRIIARVTAERNRRNGVMARSKNAARKGEQDWKPFFLNPPTSFQVVPGTAYMAVAWQDGAVDVIDVETGTCEATYAAGGGGGTRETVKLSAMAFIDPPTHAGDGRRHLGGGSKVQDGGMEKEDTSGKEAGGRRGEMSDGRIGGDGKERGMMMVTGYSNGMVRLWPAWGSVAAGGKGVRGGGTSPTGGEGGREVAHWKASDRSPILGLHYIRKERVLVLLSLKSAESPFIAVYDCDALAEAAAPISVCPLRHVPCTASALFTLAQADRPILAVGFQDGLVQLHSPTSRQDNPAGPRVEMLRVDGLEGHATAVIDIRASHDGTRLLTLSSVRELLEWDLLRGVMLRNLSFDFSVECAEYADTSYGLVVMSQGELRRAPAAELKITLKGNQKEGLNAGGEGEGKGAAKARKVRAKKAAARPGEDDDDEEEEEEEEEEAATAEAGKGEEEEDEEEDELREKESSDRLLEISARYGLEVWKSISAKAFAQGFYGSTDFLGPFEVSGVVDKSFHQEVEKDLPLQPLYLFSRHKGVLQKKIADAFSTQKLVELGDPSWNRNKRYNIPGGSSKVSEEIRGMQQRAAATPEEETEEETGEVGKGLEQPKGGWATKGGQQRILEGGPVEEEGGSEGRREGGVGSSQTGERDGGEEGGRRGGTGRSPLPGLGSQGLSNPGPKWREGGALVGRDGVPNQDRGPLNAVSELLAPKGTVQAEKVHLVQNEARVIESNQLPVWAKAGAPIPGYVLNALQPSPRRHKDRREMESEGTEWWEHPDPRRPRVEVEPWVSTEVKKALSKQGLLAQQLSVSAEEWDAPEVVEMLTRTRISELRSLAAQPGAKHHLPQTDEKYIFGSSPVLDALLTPQGPACPFPPKGRSISVPLTNRTSWVSEEAPATLAGLDIRPGARGPERRGKGGGGPATLRSGGAHLPSTMQRLHLLPAATQAPKLLTAGRLGSLKDLHAATMAEQARMAAESTMAGADGATMEAGTDAPATTPMAGGYGGLSPAPYYQPSASVPPQNPYDTSASATPIPPRPSSLPAEHRHAVMGGSQTQTEAMQRTQASTMSFEGTVINPNENSELYPHRQPPHVPLPDLANANQPPEEEERPMSMRALLRRKLGKGNALSEGEEVSLLLEGIRTGRKGSRPEGGGLWGPAQKWTPPVDGDHLLLFSGEILPFFPTVRDLTPCKREATGETGCFFAEVRLQGESGIAERVILKEASKKHYHGLPQAMVDAMKPMFGINRMDVRRVRLNAKVRRKDEGCKEWVFPHGTNNFQAIDTTAEGGTIYLLFRDYAHGVRSTEFSVLEGTVRKGKLRRGRGTLYASRELLLDLLITAAFRIMLEGNSFDLESVLVLPSGCTLPVSEMEALNRRFPARGALEGVQGAELKRALNRMLPYALDRIDGWWEQISLGKVWDVLALYGYSSYHLKRLVRNMRNLPHTLEAMLQPDLVPISGSTTPFTKTPLTSKAGSRAASRPGTEGSKKKLLPTDASKGGRDAAPQIVARIPAVQPEEASLEEGEEGRPKSRAREEKEGGWAGDTQVPTDSLLPGDFIVPEDSFGRESEGVGGGAEEGGGGGAKKKGGLTVPGTPAQWEGEGMG